MVMSFLQNLVGRRKTIRTVPIDELKRERILLDNEERNLKKSIDRVQGDDRRLLEEYAAAQRAGDNHQARFVARRLQEVREQARVLDVRHGFLSKQMRMINGLVLIKENDRFFANNSRLPDMDLADLQMYIERATSDGELTQDKVDTLLQTKDDATSQSGAIGDKALSDFITELNAEVDRGGLAPAGQVSTHDIDRALASVDRELASPAPVAGKSA